MMATVAAWAANPQDLPNYQEGRWELRDFKFNSGQTLNTLTLGYTTLGTPVRNAKGDVTNAILLLHGTTGTAKNWFLPSLISALYGPGQPLDAGRYFLIIPDGIGLGRSSKPSDGLRAEFPNYGYRDMVAANYYLVTEHLGISHLRAVVGTSMGGMHTWIFAEEYPDFMDGAIAVASLPVPVAGRNMLWRQLIIDTIRNDPDWQGGNYRLPPEGFTKIWPLFGIMTDGAKHLQELAPTRDAAIKRYRDMAAAAQALDANDMLYRFEASADYNPQPGLEKITVPFLAINFEDDTLNPADLGILEKEIQRVRQGRAVTLSGGAHSFGHQNLTQGKLWALPAGEFLEALKPTP